MFLSSCLLSGAVSFLLDNVVDTPVTSHGQKAFTAGQKQELLDKHNALRAGEGASDMVKMKWNKDLEKLAQTHADKCAFDHSPQADRTNKFGFR